MAQKKYSLYNPAPIEGDQHLVAEIGKSYIALVLGTSNKISGFEYFAAEEENFEELMSYIKHHSQLLDTSYSETRVYYNLEESVLVPVGYFNSSVASEFTDLAFGPKAATRINVENVNVQPSLVNVYRSSEHWQEIIPQYFRAVTKRHLFSKLLESASADALRVQFYTNELVAIAKKGNHLQLARSFEFLTDEDAVYHLLNVCKQTAIDPAETTINISGFIEENSTTLQLLRKYFGKVVLEKAASSLLPKEELAKYPLHYFTPFFNLLS